MGCINVREGDGVVNIFKVTGCGAPAGATANRLTLTQISEITWEDTIDEGDQVTERNFGGRKCYSAAGADEITHVALSITTCGVITALDNFLMNSEAFVDGEETTGFGRRDLSSAAAVAVEVLIPLDQTACSGTGGERIFSILFPFAKNWRPNGGSTLNGEQLLKPQYSGKAYKNEQLAALGALPAELDHWEGLWDTTHWYSVNVFDKEDVASYPEDLTALTCEPYAYSGS